MSFQPITALAKSCEMHSSYLNKNYKCVYHLVIFDGIII